MVSLTLDLEAIVVCHHGDFIERGQTLQPRPFNHMMGRAAKQGPDTVSHIFFDLLVVVDAKPP